MIEKLLDNHGGVFLNNVLNKKSFVSKDDVHLSYLQTHYIIIKSDREFYNLQNIIG